MIENKLFVSPVFQEDQEDEEDEEELSEPEKDLETDGEDDEWSGDIG